LRTSHGYYVLISNANPARRNPLCVSLSDDGVTFTRMARLPIPESSSNALPASRLGSTKYDSLQYPHAIEHDGHVLIAYSRRKLAIEVVRIPIAELKKLRADP
jgi:predicted neuraminidase